MKKIIMLICGVFLTIIVMNASAYWVEGIITDIQIVAEGNANDMIVVSGDFIPCTNHAFMILSGDPYFKESYSLLLAAKLSGKPIKYFHSYCHESGYARGNGYKIL